MHSMAVGAARQEPCADPAKICIVGPGWRFTSGVSYYTCRLASALADQHETSVVSLRELLPRFLYPGKRRVGQLRSAISYPEHVQRYDGIDWWWGTSLLGALRFLRAQRADVVVMQWWTATVLHTYLVLALTARMLGARVVLEVHEMQDPGESRFAFARYYGKWGLRLMLRLSNGCLAHSQADAQQLRSTFPHERSRIAIAPHGPYDHYISSGDVSHQVDPAIATVTQAPRPSAINILFFGLIRPYKGLEDLLTVFNSLSQADAQRFWLTVVGETWDGCTEPARLIATSPYRDRISFVNEYVQDEVAQAAFAHADIVVLPYRRSSSSGTLHIAMSCGLPIVVTTVGGLPEAAGDYEGAVFVQPGDVDMLKAGIMKASSMVGNRYRDPRDWTQTVRAIFDLSRDESDMDRAARPSRA
jgi:glycosyltransferase involved in cell wall biosynthesis